MPIYDRNYMRPNPPRGNNRGVFNWQSLILRQNPVTVLIAINVIVWIVVLLATNTQGYLALHPQLVSQQPWTILTSMFLHISFWHIFSNMLVLFFFGRIVYKMMGGWRFLVIYFIGGIVGNLLYLLIGPDTWAFGASGAVYAIAGTLVVLMPKMRVALWGIIPLPLWVFAIVFLGLLSIPPFAGHDIAWQAHLGGLAVGLAAGYIFRQQMRHIIYR